MAERKRNRYFSNEFKHDTIQLVIEKGMAVRKVALDLDIHPNLLHQWRRKYLADGSDAFVGKGHLKPQEAELKRLQVELGEITIRLYNQHRPFLPNRYSFHEAVEESLRLRELEKFATKAMVKITLGDIPLATMNSHIVNKVTLEDLSLLYNAALHEARHTRKKSLAIIYYLYGIGFRLIAKHLSLSHKSIKRYIKTYNQNGTSALLIRAKSTVKKQDDPRYKEQLLAIICTPPSEYGINRTTWTHKLVKKEMDEKGFFVGKNTVLKIIKNAGYRFRKAREVLTSNDPNYKEKLKNITRILSRLGALDRFFSIDEFGPFSIKKRGGRLLVPKKEYPTIPQYQISKGFLIITAALELSTNQVTHFYSKKKDSEEMIRLLGILINKYSGCRRIYFSWDAASWHSSKVCLAKVNEVNKYRYRKEHNTPIVKLAPLPARAQFLNVIESVFSGMASAIIHNSDYKSVDDAKTAINRYFSERNAHFKKHPKRAGDKIWGMEEVPSKFKEGQICKNKKWLRFSSI
jgi:transposase-like protein